MISGVRLTQLKYGEPLLGTSFGYNGLYGVDAVEKRLEKLFSIVNYFGFDFVIDTIDLNEDESGDINLSNNGLYSNVWSLERRLDCYKKMQTNFGIKLVIELDFPNNLNEHNWKKYADYIKQFIISNKDIYYWQIADQPESIKNNQYKCDPIAYVKLLRSICSLKVVNSNLRIGGPGIYKGLIDFHKDVKNCWLSQSMGDVYTKESEEYETIGSAGFLNYIDFFSIHGRQEDVDLSYNKFSDVIGKLQQSVKSKINQNISIFSINQGRVAKKNEKDKLEIQGYNEIKEILNAYKNGVFCFKNQLIDEIEDDYAWEGYFDTNLSGRGILYNQINDDMYKPASNTYQFILNSLKEYFYVGKSNIVFESNKNIDYITLYNKDPNCTNKIDSPTKSITIIWSKNHKENFVTLTPHFARSYSVRVGENISLTQSANIDFSKHDFVMVSEIIEKDLLDIDDINSELNSRLTYAENAMIGLLRSLPSSYNKEITDTNYYKMLRSLSLEIADAKIEAYRVKNNQYLDTVTKESLYNNFGVLVNLTKKDGWSDDKYRRLIKGVTKSLLDGPTLESIEDAIKLFTNFNVNIKELYKEAETENGNKRTQFVFAVEIEKSLSADYSQDEIERDVDYVIDIVKPAHTLRLLMIGLTGDENYRDQFGLNNGYRFEDSDLLEIVGYDQEIQEGTFGWKNKDYDGQIKTATGIEYNPLINGGLFIGPRYALFDNDQIDMNIGYKEEEIKEWLEDMDSLLSYNGKEEYVTPEELLHLEVNMNEHKFGLLIDNIIQFNGANGKILNKYRLGYCSKLKDELFSQVEFANSEKYNFYSGLTNAFQFNPRQPVDENIQGFPISINGHFGGSNDILKEISMNLFATYETKDIKQELEVQNIYTDVVSKIILEDNIFSVDFIENKIKNIIEDSIIELTQLEKYNFKDNADFVNSNLILDLEENINTTTITTLDHCRHLRYISRLNNTSNLNVVSFPYNVNVNKVEDYLKIFINGKLIPTWKYKVIYYKDTEFISGIRFESCYKVNDVFTAMIYSNKMITFEPYVKEESLTNLNLQHQEIIERAKDASNIEFIIKEKISKITEILEVLRYSIHNHEKFEPKGDIYEISDILDSEDSKDWVSVLNSNEFTEDFDVEYINLEYVKIKDDIFNIENVNSEFSEKIKSPFDVIVFYMDHSENNITLNQNIEDSYYMSYDNFENNIFINKDDSFTTSADYNIEEHKYGIDVDTMIQFKNKNKKLNKHKLGITYKLQDKLFNMDFGSFESVQINKEEELGFFIKEQEVLSLEDIKDDGTGVVNMLNEDDIDSCKDEQIKTTASLNKEEAFILQSNLDKTYVFNSIKTVGYDLDGAYIFPSKLVLDSDNIEITCQEDILICENRNNYNDENYSFKKEEIYFTVDDRLIKIN